MRVIGECSYDVAPALSNSNDITMHSNQKSGLNVNKFAFRIVCVQEKINNSL